MRILFLQGIVYEHLGIMWLSACLKKAGHETELFIEDAEPKFLAKAIAYKPDLVAFSCITGSQDWVVEAARQIKRKSNPFIVVGGPHPTHFPEMINHPEIDAVCIGEGETAIVELADKLSLGKDITKIKNLWVKKDGKVHKNQLGPLITDLDSLPFPDRGLFYKYDVIRNNPQKRFLSTRGCPYQCSFCYNITMQEMHKGLGPWVRRRKAGYLIQEILEVKRKYRLKTVYFEDDTFDLDKKWIKEFLMMYREHVKLPFIALIRANHQDEETVRDYKRSGCYRLFFGVESGDENYRNNVLKKNLTDAQIINAARLFKKYKIKFKTYNMMGLPNETVDMAFKTVELNSRIGTDYPWCSIFQPYPGTHLASYAMDCGLIGRDFSPDDIKPYYSSTVMKGKNIRKLVNLERLFVFAVKFPGLKPLWKRLIELPPNLVFDLMFLIGFTYTYMGSENIDIMYNLKYGLKNLSKLFIVKKKKAR
jgi:anaerobic magnesium-protoporphyrin IX monomethyl ester cyclase